LKASGKSKINARESACKWTGLPDYRRSAQWNISNDTGISKHDLVKISGTQGALEAERGFRKETGYRAMPALVAALRETWS
jgi:hypothetical protein